MTDEGRDRIEDPEVPHEDPGSSEPSDSRPSQADRLVEYVLSSGIELFCDQLGDAWARVPVGSHLETLKCRSKSLKHWLAGLMWKAEAKAVKADVLSSTMNVLEAKARFEGSEHELFNRVAHLQDTLWYDLCDPQWRAVKITQAGWEIVEKPPILFARHSHQRLQLEPRRGGDLHDFLRFVNLPDAAHGILLLVYTASCFVESIQHPIPVVHGPQGAAKTTLLRMQRRLIDPSATETLSLPTRPTELVQQLAHHHFAPYDNLTNMPDWASDTLCRAVSGQGFSKRELYSDDDDVIYSFRRCSALNGINVAARKPDLLDRSILIGLDRIKPADRKSERALWVDFDEARPALLGAIFDVLSRALSIHHEVQLTELPRMADFAIWGVAIAQALGHSQDEFLDAYEQNFLVRNEEVLTDNPVARLVGVLMESRDVWNGSATELLGELEGLAGTNHVSTRARGWPKSPSTLSRRLNEVRPNLEAEGIEITDDRSRGKRTVRLQKTTSNAVTAVTEPATPVVATVPRDGTDDGIGTTPEVASQMPSPKKARSFNNNDGSDGDDGISGDSSPRCSCGSLEFWKSAHGQVLCQECGRPPDGERPVRDDRDAPRGGTT